MYETLPFSMSTSIGGTIGWCFLFFLAIAALIALMHEADAGDGFLGALLIFVTILLGTNSYGKVFHYEKEGTVKEFCTKEEEKKNVIKEINGVKYSLDSEKICIEKTQFVAVDSEWKKVVK